MIGINTAIQAGESRWGIGFLRGRSIKQKGTERSIGAVKDSYHPYLGFK
jgi:hypothetical protein